MTGNIEKKEYIVCVDSDGCAMDVMDIKHEQFFGPLAADIFKVKNRELFLKEWNRVNLFSETRGVNRFKALVIVLEFAKEKGETLIDISALQNWAKNTASLSHKTLEEEMKSNRDQSLVKALEWSKAVNEGVEKNLTGKDKPFDGVKEDLAKLAEVANIAIVSTANDEALQSEWTRHGLMPYVDYVYGQEKGSKVVALAEIHAMGYSKDHILMVGDAPGDETAARKNGVYFFPILFGKEKESWDNLTDSALPKFINGEYNDTYNEKMSQVFHDHLQESIK